MPIVTLVIGYVPLTDTAGKKPRQIRENAYMKELFAEFDFGEVHYSSLTDWKTKADEINPLFIILLGNDYYGHEVHAYKKDALLYASYDAGQIFYRKAEVGEKKAKQHKAFTEIAGLIKKAREDGEKEIESMRKFATMSYNDWYEMIKKALISDDKTLHDQAWELLFGKNVHGDFVWMRVQFLADTWEHADGKGKEELMCMAMEQHVTEGMARKLEEFTDTDGQKYHQYMFCDFQGYDLNYIRRIPFGEKGQDKYAYEALISEETPKNFVRVMLEAGEMRKRKEEYFAHEVAKMTKVLTAWKADPAKSKRELRVAAWREEDSDEDPLTERELGSLKRFLHEHDQATFETLFEIKQ